MRCGQCDFENPDGMRFCGGCGQSLLPACPDCGNRNPPEFRFCGSCGAALTDAGRPDHAERRHLTVMFCDLVDSTPLSEALDPEEYRALVRDYQGDVATIIETWKGHLAQFLGDGVLAYFGFPRAHEDDAFCAVHAGLDIVQAIRRLSERKERENGVRVRVRVGIHSGTVVAGAVGSGEKAEQLAMGSTPNVAARLQGLASPNEVLISDMTFEVVKRQIAADHLGPRQLKGVSHPIEVFRATGLRTPGEDSADDETPFVGRERELGDLRAQHASVMKGRGQVIHVRGDPGIGKSRLITEFKRGVSGQSQWLTCRCSAYHENVDLYPVVEMLKRRMGITDGAMTASQLAELQTWLTENGQSDVGTTGALAAALGIDDQVDSAPVSRRRRFDAILAWLYSAASREPLVLLVEDLHWADPSTLELLGILAESAQAHPILMLLSARPHFTPPWEPRSNHALVDLNRLDSELAETILKRIGADRLPENVCRQLLERADGVPLFLEQLVRAALTDLPASGVELERFVPNSLHDLLMARIDALGQSREICQIGALLGRSFSYEMLLAATSHPPQHLDDWIGRVLDAGLLIRIGSGSRAVFRFRHSLIQDTAYESMLKSRRRKLHGQVADAINERFPDLAANEPATLARHLEGAARWRDAVDAYARAGARAARRGAFVEAIRSYQKGLALIPHLPEGAERDNREYELLRDLQSPMHAHGGYAAEDMRPILARITELLSRRKDPESQYRVLMAEWGFHCMRGHRHETQQLSDALYEFAARSPPATLISGAMFAVGSNHFYRGDLFPAARYLQQSIDISCEQGWGERAQDLEHPAFLSRLVMGSCLSITGRPDSGRAMIEEALAVARLQDLPFAVVQCLAWLSFCDVDIERDPAESLEKAEEQSRIARDHEMDSWNANLARVCSLLRLGEPDAPAAAVKAMHRMSRSTIVTTGYMYTQLGAALVQAGELDSAQAALKRAFEVAEHNLGTNHLPEAHRVQGIVLAAQHRRTEALEHLQKAIDMNANSGAVVHELKAHAALREYLPADAEPHTARFRVLLDGLTEGRETPLIQRVSKLLA